MDKKAHFAAAGFALIFGFTFMFSKKALDLVSPMGLIAYRFLTAIVFFEIIRRLKLVTIRFQKTDLKMLFIVALFQPVLYFVLETYGLDKITSAEAGMMIALIPIFTSIFGSLILREKPAKIQFFFIGLSVFGIIFIQLFKMGSSIDIQWIGFLLLLGAIISAALYNIASRNASKTLRPHEITYFMMLLGAVTFNLFYLVELAFNGTIEIYVTNLRHPDLLLPILYLGVIASIGGFFLVNFALGKLEAHVISVYSNLATVVAVVAGALFLSEAILWYHYVGASLIIVGVYGTVRYNRINRKKAMLFNKQK